MTVTLLAEAGLGARTAEAAAFDRAGLCVLDGRLPSALVRRCRDAALAQLDVCLERVRARTDAELAVGTAEGWAEIVHRAPGRYDILHGTDAPPFTDPLLGREAPWADLVRSLLGGECREVYRGLLIALPGGGEQPWHTDGEHLFPGQGPHLPVHCLNVFVPLVDLTPDNGPTEFCPGSHRLTGGLARAFEQDRDLLARIGYDRPTSAPCLDAGSMLLFDYRLVHRGLANRGDAPRPVLYITYAVPWFCDVRNFPERHLFAAVPSRFSR